MAASKSALYLFVTGVVDNMSQTLSTEKSLGNKNPWDQAIADARARLRRIEAKAMRVRLAIKTFEAGKADGEVWPGEDAKRSATQN
jgi:hypothetical protein